MKKPEKFSAHNQYRRSEDGASWWAEQVGAFNETQANYAADRVTMTPDPNYKNINDRILNEQFTTIKGKK